MNKICMILFLFFILKLQAPILPYQNPNLSSEERAEDLISRLTIDEKAALMCDVSEQLPDFEDYSMKGRTYKFMDDTLFPFGYGLSYTTFSIGEAELNKTSLKENDTLELLIPVSNTGKADGTEMVQVYIRKVGDTDGPLRTLRGFKKVSVSAGESTEAVVNLPYKSFEFFNRILKETTVTVGDYEVLYGNSSAEKDLKKVIVTIL